MKSQWTRCVVQVKMSWWGMSDVKFGWVDDAGGFDD